MLGGLPDGVLLTIGLILLVSGGELVVQGSIRIAGLLGMPSFLVGFTLVAIGTSLPELGVVLNAINRGSPEAVDLAVGGKPKHCAECSLQWTYWRNVEPAFGDVAVEIVGAVLHKL